MLRDRYVEFSGHRFDCLDAGFGENEAVDVVVRPEDVDIVPAENTWYPSLLSFKLIPLFKLSSSSSSKICFILFFPFRF